MHQFWLGSGQKPACQNLLHFFWTCEDVIRFWEGGGSYEKGKENPNKN